MNLWITVHLGVKKIFVKALPVAISEKIIVV